MEENIPAIEAGDLRKKYQDGTEALKGITISIKAGQVFGLLGPNGAGKTTFVRIAATQLLPSSGFVRVLGHDAVKEAGQIRQRIAVVPQEARPFSLQTPYEHVLTYLIARGVNFSVARSRAEKTLVDLKLHTYRNVICANLSGGLRQRVLIAMAISTDADLLMLDEPSMGLDPVARVDVWNLIRDYVGKSGKSIVLTTHYMDEAESLSDNLAIVNDGRIIEAGTPKEIKARLGTTHAIVIRLQGSTDSTQIEKLLKGFGKVLRAGNSYRVLCDQTSANELATDCLKQNIDFFVRQINLEDVFISKVGHELEEQERSVDDVERGSR